ncbi:sigma-70 family RNA polymerase sigma factor [Actinoplanes nipponensis]|nr:sigma-70 family RNA polymerase sigma factor [Actinoplanes nipponensis]
MRSTRTNDAAVVAAAQAGDHRALEELTASGLPLVYSIVRRGLGAHPDVDDVVQEVMLRALRKLPKLRTPATFRAWLAAIAVRQVSTHLRRRERNAGRTAAIEEAVGLADDRGPSEDLTALRVDLSRQRRQVERAGRWLDPDDRALLSLWWLEVADQLTRAELAAALGLSVPHAGVRVQRMRTQLEASRALVAALELRPRCPRLAAVAESWDGRPSPLWRKRLTRHVRSCPDCARAGAGFVAPERLFPAFALLPVPIGLGLAVLGKLALDGMAVGTAVPGALIGAAGPGAASGAGAGAKAGLIGQLVQAAALHPVVSTVAAGALVAGTGVATMQLADPPPPAPRVIAGPPRVTGVPGSPPPARSSVATPRATPTPAAPRATGAGTVTLGPLSLEAQNAAGRFVASENGLGVLVPAGPDTAAVTRNRATFTAVEGLADSRCVSFRYADGRYLRHASWRLRLSPNEGTPLFRGDATFCPRTGVAAGSVTLESSNYPGWFLRHRGDELWVDQSDGSATFRADGSFRVRPPLTR